MTMPHAGLTRRALLRGTGTLLALPFLDAMRSATGAEGAEPPRRLVAINTSLGIHAENLFPAEAGAEYSATPYLKVLEPFRKELTVFSGLSHPEVDGGHSSEASFLTAAAHPGQAGFKNSISLDQYAVEQLAPDTRFPFLSLGTAGGSSLSYTRAGVRIPNEERPSVLFKKLFVNGSPGEVREQLARLASGQSVMDGVLEEANDLRRSVGPRDRERLDQYLSSIREVEIRLERAEAWAVRPKPAVEAKAPTDVANAADILARSRLMFDLVHLALLTDSTRIVTLHQRGHNSVPPIAGVTQDWHTLSHHGKDPEKLAQLRTIETELMQAHADFLAKLRGTPDGGGTLLDRTTVLYGSNLGNASNHDTRNLPILVAGGGFKHGRHLAFDKERNAPLGNLFVSILQRLGVETDRFATGRGTLTGFEA